METPSHRVQVDVSLHREPVEGEMLLASGERRRFTGYLELIQLLEAERAQPPASGG